MRSLVTKLVLVLAGLYVLAAVLSRVLADPLEALGSRFVAVFGLPGFTLGTFLADGLHFPIPPQFYMLLTIALDLPVGWVLFSITTGSLLGGVLEYAIARRLGHFAWIERRMDQLGARRLVSLLHEHPYRAVVIASLTPISYAWLCFIAGLSRLALRPFCLLCVLRIPKLLLYFLIVRAGWAGALPE